MYEGIHRGQLGLSPYDGDCTHQAPLVLLLATPLYISRHWRYGWLVRAALCCALDVCIAKCLARSARTAVRVEVRGLVWEEHALSQQRRVDMPRVVESSVSSLPWVPDAVAAMYLLHPYTLLTSCALSTSVLCYAALALGLSWACQGVWRLGRWLAFGALGGGGTDVLYARAAVKPCLGVRGRLPEPVLPARHPWILVPPAALVSAAGTRSGMCMSSRRVPWCLSPLSASTEGPGMG